MKNRVIKLLMLSGMIVSLNLLSVPVWGHEYNFKTDVAAQEESTDTDIIFRTEKTIEDILNSGTKSYSGWATTRVNVRSEASTESDILGVFEFNEQITYVPYNESWVTIRYNSGDDYVIAYVSKQYISDYECEYDTYSIPSYSGYKSYMPYTAITSTSSLQYKLQHTYAYTGNYGIRMVNGRYCVALGTAFNANIGDYVDLILENGTIIPVIIADVKANKDTGSSNIFTSSNGCMSEFIVDSSSLNSNIRKMGNVSYANDSWDSPVVTVKIYDKNIFD